jgi:hypothetical protein
LHTHAWRWNERSNKWIVDHGDQSWINHCLHMSFDAYRKALGRHCLSFRFGDRWMSNDTMDTLDSLGVKFDLTIEPGRSGEPVISEAHTGTLPDYTATPTWPYRPARGNFRRPGRITKRDLWAIPLSTGRSWPPGPFGRVTRAARAIGIDFQRTVEAMPLYFCLDCARFKSITDNLLAVWRKRYLAPVVRSDAGIDLRRRPNMQRNAEFLLSHPLITRFRFVKPGEAVELLT